MKKIITLYQRNYETDRLVRNEVVEGAEWVVNGEGIATQKIDGTSCMVKDNKLYKRYEVKKEKTPPQNFIPATEIDQITGKQQGWVEVGWGNEDKWHREALLTNDPDNVNLPDGTYELIGEKIQGNPEKVIGYQLEKHGIRILEDAPREYDKLKEWFASKDIEGVVWWHPDGRMVKIKKKDFGLKRIG